ncbi:hypothetical protein OROGR_009685 [Orobanche gracilis]
MVCQAASQTRFRAHKHENGIAGRTTIIIRVIACFQPLQNCQAEYFRQLLKPVTISRRTLLPDYIRSLIILVTLLAQPETREYRQMETSDLNQMAPYFNSPTLTANAAFQGQTNTDYRVGEFFKHPHPFGNRMASYPAGNPCIKNLQTALPDNGLRVSDKPIDASCARERKRFLIFDRSGNQTRLFFNPSFSPQNQVITSTVSASTQEVGCRSLSNPVVEEECDENDLNDEEGEMVENTEEIDALLYSDSDYDDDDDEYDDDDGDDEEEVTSTRHIPFITEEGSMPKRQRLLDGRYKKPSSTSLKSPLSYPCNYEDDHESSYAGERNSHDGTYSSKGDKKVKIRETLKLLGSIIPGSESNKDPVSIIEKAIFYLESMRIEAEALGLTETATYT